MRDKEAHRERERTQNTHQVITRPGTALSGRASFLHSAARWPSSPHRWQMAAWVHAEARCPGFPQLKLLMPFELDVKTETMETHQRCARSGSGLGHSRSRWPSAPHVRHFLGAVHAAATCPASPQVKLPHIHSLRRKLEEKTKRRLPLEGDVAARWVGGRGKGANGRDGER